MNFSTRYAKVLGRFAISLGALTLLGSGCLPVDHEHAQYKVNVQAVEAATKQSQAAAGDSGAAAKKADAAAARAEAAAGKAGEAAARAEAAAERAERAAAKAEAVFEKSMKK